MPLKRTGNRFTTIVLVFLLGYLCLLLYAYRGLYLSYFDAAYWIDKFEHSQWKLTQSKRSIGDDGIYIYEGLRLIHGGDPTASSAEIPPLGEYIIGFFLHFTNGYIFGLFVTSILVFCVFLLARLVTKSLLAAGVATLLVATDPLVTEQFAATMLDSVQMLFLVLSLILLFVWRKSKNLLQFILAAVSFGFFISTKFPIYVPVISVAIAYFLYMNAKVKKWLLIPLFFSLSVLSYGLTYFAYFFNGHSVRQWLAVQKYFILFHGSGYIKPNLGAAITSLVFGFAKPITQGSFVRVNEWSVSWLTVLALSLVWILKALRKREFSSPLFLIGLVLLGLLFVSTLIPFYTRYLLLVLPFLYILFVSLLEKSRRFLLIAIFLLAFNLIVSIPTIFPTSESFMRQFSYDWEHGFFKDMYEGLLPSSKILSREQFNRTGQKLLYDAHIEAASVKVGNVSWSRKSVQFIPLTITYFTRELGPFTERRTLLVSKENGIWKAQWDWGVLASGLDHKKHFETVVMLAKRGSIIKNGIEVARDGESYLISIIPNQVDPKKEEEMLNLLDTIFGKRIDKYRIHNRYVENTQPDWPVALGVVMQELLPENLFELKRFPGILLTPAIGRLTHVIEISNIGRVANTQFEECCSLLYNTTSYDGLDKLEKQLNDTLKGENGGYLVIKDAVGNVVRTIIQKNKFDGKNVKL